VVERARRDATEDLVGVLVEHADVLDTLPPDLAQELVDALRRVLDALVVDLGLELRDLDEVRLVADTVVDT